jgi:hypothetical protein
LMAISLVTAAALMSRMASTASRTIACSTDQHRYHLIQVWRRHADHMQSMPVMQEEARQSSGC